MVGPEPDKAGAAFAAIASNAVRALGGTTLPIWLYVEAGDGWIEPSVFRVGDNAAEYVLPDMEFVDVVENAWYDLERDQRWAAMEMDIADGRFTTRLRYHDEVPRDDGYSSMERSEAAIAARFGDKPVIYPD